MRIADINTMSSQGIWAEMARARANSKIHFRHCLGDGRVLEIGQVIPCGLIINELLTNAIKYALPCGRTGRGRRFLSHFRDGVS